MYLPNQSFTDEETLMESLFDFELGEMTPLLEDYRNKAKEQLDADVEFYAYKSKIEETEERIAADEEQRLVVLATLLKDDFEKFEVKDKSFFGLKDGVSTLLASIDLE